MKPRLLVRWMLLVWLLGTVLIPLNGHWSLLRSVQFFEWCMSTLVPVLPGLATGVLAWSWFVDRFRWLRTVPLAHWASLVLLAVILHVGAIWSALNIGQLLGGHPIIPLRPGLGEQWTPGVGNQLNWQIIWLLMVLVPRIVLRRSVVAVGWYEPQPKVTTTD